MDFRRIVLASLTAITIFVSSGVVYAQDFLLNENEISTESEMNATDDKGFLALLAEAF